MQTRHFGMAVSILLAASLAACSSGDSGSSLPHTVTAGMNATATTQSTHGRTAADEIGAAPALSELPGIAITAGGPAVGSWAADQSAKGGWNAPRAGAVDTSHVVDPAPAAMQSFGRAFRS